MHPWIVHAIADVNTKLSPVHIRSYFFLDRADTVNIRYDDLIMAHREEDTISV